MRLVSSISVFMIMLCSIACDLDGKKNCDWVLEPEPDLVANVEVGFVALCARNRKTMKQDCRLQAPLAIAKTYQGKLFRYDELKVQSSSLPRSIAQIKFCGRLAP